MGGSFAVYCRKWRFTNLPFLRTVSVYFREEQAPPLRYITNLIVGAIHESPVFAHGKRLFSGGRGRTPTSAFIVSHRDYSRFASFVHVVRLFSGAPRHSPTDWFGTSGKLFVFSGRRGAVPYRLVFNFYKIPKADRRGRRSLQGKI